MEDLYLEKSSFLHVFFIAAYLVQLQALFVHAFSNSGLQQHHFYLNRKEWFNYSHIDFNKYYGVFLFFQVLLKS